MYRQVQDTTPDPNGPAVRQPRRHPVKHLCAARAQSRARAYRYAYLTKAIQTNHGQTRRSSPGGLQAALGLAHSDAHTPLTTLKTHARTHAANDPIGAAAGVGPRDDQPRQTPATGHPA